MKPVQFCSFFCFLSIALSAVGIFSTRSFAQSSNPNPETSPLPSNSIKLSGSGATRYDSRDNGESKKLQAAIVLGLTIDTKNKFKLVAIATTAPKYAAINYTYFDFDTKSAEETPASLYFRQLYVTKALGKMKASAGALPALDQFGGHTGFGNNGLVDGARFYISTVQGDLGVTTGSLFDMNNLDIVHRNRKLNYVEVYLTRPLAENLYAELSFGKIDSDTFLRFAAKEDIEILTDRVISVIIEGLENRHQGADQLSAALSLNTEFTSLIGFNKRYRGYLDVNLRYSYGDPNIGIRGLVGDDLFMPGHNLRIGLGGKINRSNTLQWFSISETFRKSPGNRDQLGLKAKIP
jgi:hypothetical protein